MANLLPDPHARALAVVADTLQGARITWTVSGSAGLALRGFRVTPSDLDIELPETDIAEAAASLGWTARERIDSGGRSVGASGEIAGLPVELVGGFTVRGPGGALPPDDDYIRLFSSTVDVDGREVWVQPVEEYVARAIVAGDEHRLDRIAVAAPVGFALDESYISLRLAAARAAR